MTISNPRISATVDVVSAEIFSTGSAPPIAYTDLDASSGCGANEAVLLLYVYNGTGAPRNYHFRYKGEALESNNIDGGVNVGQVNDGELGLFIVQTDVNGVIQWKSNSADIGCSVYVKAFWKKGP